MTQDCIDNALTFPRDDASCLLLTEMYGIILDVSKFLLTYIKAGNLY